jgi:hypothetical protein
MDNDVMLSFVGSGKICSRFSFVCVCVCVLSLSLSLCAQTHTHTHTQNYKWVLVPLAILGGGILYASTQGLEAVLPFVTL